MSFRGKWTKDCFELLLSTFTKLYAVTSYTLSLCDMTCNNTVITIISSINLYDKAHHLTNVSSFTFLTRRSRQALDRKQEKLNILFGHDRCKLVVKCYSCCPAYLQTNWAWRSGESSGSFVSLLAKQALLTSGTRLTICTLKRHHSQERQMLVWLMGSQLQQVRY